MSRSRSDFNAASHIDFPKSADLLCQICPAVVPEGRFAETAATRARSRPSPTPSAKSEPPQGGFVLFVAATSVARPGSGKVIRILPTQLVGRTKKRSRAI